MKKPIVPIIARKFLARKVSIMNRTVRIILLLLLSLSVTSFGWFRTYSLDGNTTASWIAELPDGRLLLTGRTGSLYFFMWTNENGDVIDVWRLDWGDSTETYQIYDATLDPVNESVYFSMIKSTSPFTYPTSMFLGKMSIDGDSMWVREYELFHNANLVENNVFFDTEYKVTVVFSDIDSLTDERSVVTAKIDTSGALMNYKRQAIPENFIPLMLAPTDDHSFYIWSSSVTAPRSQLIIEFSSLGDSLNAELIPLDDYWPIGFMYYPDYGIFMSGKTPAPEQNVWFANIGSTLSISWSRSYDLCLHEGISRQIIPLPGGNVASTCCLKDAWRHYQALVVFDAETGDTLHVARYDSVLNAVDYGLTFARNGDLISCGIVDSFAYIFRVDSIGNNVESNITEKPHTPASFSLSAHPNPFNGAVRITLDGVRAIHELPLRVEIFDLSGRRVAELPSNGTVGEALVASRNAANGDFPETGKREGTSPSPTPREFTWTPDESLPSGVYLVRARIDSAQRPDDGRGDLAPTGNAQAVKRVVYLK